MERSDDDSEPEVRHYEVTYFGENFGAFLLPTGEHMEDPETRMRPIVTKPYREGEGEDATYFWVESDPDGEYVTVTWKPETAELVEEAERFYNEAHGLNRYGAIDPDKQPPFPARSVEETRLIRAALANPDEDPAYLAYAEWLAQRADTYGEFIQLTIQLEPLDYEDKRRERLEKRHDRLLRKHGAEWVRGLTEMGLFPGFDEDDREDFDPNWWFNDKGVIDDLDIPAGTFVFTKHPARLFAAAPFLRQLTVNDPAITVADLAVIPQMAQLDTLTVEVGAGDVAAFRRFAESPHFGGLRWLTLANYGFGPQVARVLASAQWLSNLQGLFIESNAIGDDGAKAFAQSPYCANLEELELNNNNLTDHGLIALCRSAHLTNLGRLDLKNSTFTTEGMRAFSSAVFAPTLLDLDLYRCGLDSRAIAAFATAELPELRTLEVSEQAIGDEAMRALVEAPFFRSLELFWANGCDLGNGALEAIASAGAIDLQELALRDNHIEADGIAALVRSEAAAKIEDLDLSGNPLGREGVVELAGAELPALERLNLNGIKLGKEAIQALLRAPWRKHLTQLDISADCLSERGLEVLRERFGEDVVSTGDEDDDDEDEDEDETDDEEDDERS